MLSPVRPVAVIAAMLAALAGCGGDSPAATPITPNTSGWWRDKVVYEVFVRSFADSDGDGVGDLEGLTARLDYLNDGDPATTTDLGIDAVWLMPIHPSPSYHGYDVTDYRGIQPAYGTSADFDAFVAAAHRRGIKVILDAVLNHSSSQHPWFTDSASGASATRRDWYSWRTADPGWIRPIAPGGSPWYPRGGAWFYAWFTPSMPDLNLRNSAVEAELVDSLRSWLARGVDGFRLDAVRHYDESADGAMLDQPENHAFLKRVRQQLQASYPNTLLAAEAWTSTQTVATYYGQGDEAQLAFSFDLADAIKTSLKQGDAGQVLSTLGTLDAALSDKDRGYDAPFLSNHDQVRVARDLGGDAGAARVAAALLLALPGTPFLYYGEELGMQGGAGGDDRQKRTPFRWTAEAGHGFTTGTPWFDAGEAAGVSVAEQRPDPASLWNLYRRLIALRHGRTALATGSISLPALGGAPTAAMALLRADSAGRVLFVANLGTAAIGPFTADVTGTPAVLLAEGLTGSPAAAAGKVSFAGLGPRGFAFVSLD